MKIIPTYLLLIEMPGGGELLVILFVVLLLFGGKKIPELMRGLGRGMREFNDAKSNITKELEEGMKPNDKTTGNSNNLHATPGDANVPPAATNGKSGAVSNTTASPD